MPAEDIGEPELITTGYASNLYITMSEFDEILAINRNRAQMYAFLSKVYEVELTRELIDKMRNGNSPLVDIGALEGPGD